jgi:hypothetical protein
MANVPTFDIVLLPTSCGAIMTWFRMFPEMPTPSQYLWSRHHTAYRRRQSIMRRGHPNLASRHAPSFLVVSNDSKSKRMLEKYKLRQTKDDCSVCERVQETFTAGAEIYCHLAIFIPICRQEKDVWCFARLFLC